MTSLDSLQQLLKDLPEFEQMPPPRQAAFRARLTRYLKQVKDNELRAILEGIQEKIGEPERKAKADRMTPESLESELPRYGSLTSSQRAAYKAKVQRLLNKAKEAGDTETVNRLTEILAQVAQVEETEALTEIKALAKKLLG